MGLDMYAHSLDIKDVISDVEYAGEPEDKNEIFYWRKHHNLHGWMKQLYERKGGTEEFNCVPVRLQPSDLFELQSVILAHGLPDTTGFFFGDNPPDEDSDEQDLLFIAKALSEINRGRAVYYSSWW